MTKANPCGIAGIASPPVSTLRRPAFFRKLGVPSQSSHGCMVAPSDFAVDLGAMAAMGTFLPSLELFVPWPPWPPWPPASRKSGYRRLQTELWPRFTNHGMMQRVRNALEADQSSDEPMVYQELRAYTQDCWDAFGQVIWRYMEFLLA